MKKSIIGIVSKHYKSSLNKVRPDMYIRDEIKQAIFDNGGICIGILLPKDEINATGKNWNNNLTSGEYSNLITQIKLCDGIIFQGGDFHDNYEMIIAKYCYDNDIPTLGICCGQNILVWALDGTIKKVTNPEKHNQPNEDYIHGVYIDTSSRFHDIIKKENIMVNSRHKRTVDECPLLDMVGICEDGYADVVESKDKTFYMGVRFHPESLYKIDESMNKIFIEFINKCNEVHLKQ